MVDASLARTPTSAGPLAPDPRRDQGLLPRRGTCGIDLRAPRRQRRQAGVSRLRDGARITTDTLDSPARLYGRASRLACRRRPSGAARQPPRRRRALRRRRRARSIAAFASSTSARSISCSSTPAARSWRSPIASRSNLAHIFPRPPALRLFDAGVGDGTVLARTMRGMHARFPTMPFYIVGKEISLEDIRLTLDKMADRLFEHPSTVLVLTNLYYAEAPWLTPRAPAAAHSFVWKDVRADRQLGARIRRADHGARAVSQRALARGLKPEDRQPGLRAAGGAGALPRRPLASCSTASCRAPGASRPTTTWSSPRSHTGRRHPPSSRRAAS